MKNTPTGTRTVRANADEIRPEAVPTSDSRPDILATLYVIAHFLPLLTSIALLINFLFAPSNFVADYILLPIAAVGWLSAIIVRPLAIIKTVLSKSWAVFKFFFGFPVFLVSTTTAVVCGVIAFSVLTMAAVFAPAAFTICFFLKDCMD